MLIVYFVEWVVAFSLLPKKLFLKCQILFATPPILLLKLIRVFRRIFFVYVCDSVFLHSVLMCACLCFLFIVFRGYLSVSKKPDVTFNVNNLGVSSKKTGLTHYNNKYVEILYCSIFYDFFSFFIVYSLIYFPF